jgi:Ca2+-binding EF-hand superfamily protein
MTTRDCSELFLLAHLPCAVLQMDEIDMILMQPSTDKDDFQKLAKSFSYSPRQQFHSRQGNPLKFHLNTTDDHGGYMLSLSQARIRHFRHILETSGLHQISSETACNHILANRSRTVITKKEFDSAIKSMLPSNRHDRHTARLISDIFSGIFAAFDREGAGEANALEVACGFTVLCWGKKSDKLEFAFEVLDKNKRGKLSTKDMASYLQSFLSVLLSIAFSPVLDNDPADDTVATMNGWRCDRTTASLIRAAKAGADWAASLVFRDYERNKKQTPSMSFDDFADWYTAVGYSSIPWLELLDLQKWAIPPDTK